jgi:hypothetical protein
VSWSLSQTLPQFSNPCFQWGIAQQVLGAVLIFFESIPLIFSFAWLTVLVRGLFLLAARESASVQGTARIGTQLIGSLGGFAALMYMPRLFEGPPLFLVFLVIALTFVAIVAWWPARRVRDFNNELLAG